MERFLKEEGGTKVTVQEGEKPVISDEDKKFKYKVCGKSLHFIGWLERT